MSGAVELAHRLIDGLLDAAAAFADGSPSCSAASTARSSPAGPLPDLLLAAGLGRGGAAAAGALRARARSARAAPHARPHPAPAGAVGPTDPVGASARPGHRADHRGGHARGGAELAGRLAYGGSAPDGGAAARAEGGNAVARAVAEKRRLTNHSGAAKNSRRRFSVRGVPTRAAKRPIIRCPERKAIDQRCDSNIAGRRSPSFLSPSFFRDLFHGLFS